MQSPQDPLTKIENQALADLSNEYRTLRIEEMISKKRRQLDKSSPSSDISLQKQNLDIIEGIVKVAKQLQPQAGKDETLEYVKMIKDVLLESTKNQGGRGSSFFESLVTDPVLFQRTQDIFGRGRTGETNASDIAIEKLRGERDMNNRKYDLELHKLRLEAEIRQNNLGLIAQIFGPVLAVGGNQLAQSMREKGIEVGARARNPNPASQTLQGQTAKMQIQCNCGFNDVMLVPDPPPSEIACPNCGKTLLTGPPPTGETGSQALSDSEIGDQWRNNK